MTRAALLLVPLLLAVPALHAQAAADLCEDGIQGNRVCAERSGACASVVYVPPWTDFWAGAGSCPSVVVGSGGVSACESAFAGYMTMPGFIGFAGWACASVTDENGDACVRATGGSNLFGIRPIGPVCA